MDVIIFNDRLEKFIQDLPESSAIQTVKSIELLKRFGHLLRMPESRSLGHSLFELRVRGTLEIRIIYTFRNQTSFLLHGFIKKSQHLPQKELRYALTQKQRLDKIIT